MIPISINSFRFDALIDCMKSDTLSFGEHTDNTLSPNVSISEWEMMK